MVLVDLFLAFLRIGLFAIGGAYSFLPVIEKEVVERYHWLTNKEFLDVLGAVNIFPGAISIKYATYTGYKVAGFPGVIAANFGNLLAPALMIICASAFYIKYRDLPSVKKAFSLIQAAVFAMIIAVALRSISFDQVFQVRNIIVIIISFILFFFVKIHPGLIILGVGILGFLL